MACVSSAFRSRRPAARRLTPGLLAVMFACGACGDGSALARLGPSRLPASLQPPPPAPTPTPPASPTPATPHQVVVSYEPDWDGSPAERDADGHYVLIRGAAAYCIWLAHVPATPPGHCREYTFAFSWQPDGAFPPDRWTGPTFSRGCHPYPNPINPGPCFQTPRLTSTPGAGDRHTIGIAGREFGPNGFDAETFRTELAIRFRNP